MKFEANQIKQEKIDLYQQNKILSVIPLMLQNLDSVRTLMSKNSQELSIMIIKPYDINDLEYVLEKLEQNNCPPIYAKFIKLAPTDVVFLYPDKTQDSYYSVLEQGLIQNQSIIVVVKANQVNINKLKAYIVDGRKTDGEIRKYLRGATIHPIIMKKIIEKSKNHLINNGLSEENYILLMKHIVLGNGIHTADTQEEAIEIIKRLVL